jgi:type VI protein secretion system component Hcp
MAEDSRDVLMQLVPGQGRNSLTTIPSESQADIGKDDTLATNFTAAGKSDANFFSIQDFTFQVALSSSDTAAKAGAVMKENQAQTQQQMKALEKQIASAKVPGLENFKLGGSGTSGSSSFSRFMSGGARALRGKTYPADLEAITIVKQLDATSPTLLKACLDSTTFKSGTVLKRKATGSSELRTFLRMDFVDLMIIDFAWEEDDVVKETFKFICRGAAVQYAIEEASGKLTTRSTGTWSVRDLKSHGQ